MMAALGGQLGSVQELRRHGADQRLTDVNGCTAFHLAMARCPPSVSMTTRSVSEWDVET